MCDKNIILIPVQGTEQTHDPLRGVFSGLSTRYAEMKGNISHLTLPALARESGSFHGPFPRASFGNRWSW
jgi:hypothetical protein